MFEHLDPSMVPLLKVPMDERIASCLEDRWVEYPQATATLGALHDLITYPKTQRGRCLLLTGKSNNGKSSLLAECRRRHGNRMADDGTLAFSTAAIQTPGKPDESSVISEILLALKIRHTLRDGATVKRPLLLRTVDECNLRVVFMDEFNHVNEAGKGAAPLLGFLKNLADGKGINACADGKGVSVVASGTEIAKNALLIDPQLYTRFKIIDLPQWTFGPDYLGFLAGYERVLPLARPSNLATKELATAIFRLGGGESTASSKTIGGTVDVVKGLAALAVRHGQECIDASTLARWGADNAVFLKT